MLRAGDPWRRIRTGKDCGIGKFPSHLLTMNQAWFTAALVAAALIAWLKLIALDGHLARACRAENTVLPALPHRCPPRPERTPKAAQDRHDLALGRCHRHCLGTRHRPAPSPLTSPDPVPSARKEPQGLWKPRRPGRNRVIVISRP
jgi:hypothetical protein